MLSTALRESFKKRDLFPRNTVGTLILPAVLSIVKEKLLVLFAVHRKPPWGVLAERGWADGAQGCDCPGCCHCSASQWVYSTIFKTFSLYAENLIQCWSFHIVCCIQNIKSL